MEPHDAPHRHGERVRFVGGNPPPDGTEVRLQHGMAGVVESGPEPAGDAADRYFIRFRGGPRWVNAAHLERLLPN